MSPAHWPYAVRLDKRQKNQRLRQGDFFGSPYEHTGTGSHAALTVILASYRFWGLPSLKARGAIGTALPGLFVSGVDVLTGISLLLIRRSCARWDSRKPDHRVRREDRR
jgi:hypothetical protein